MDERTKSQKIADETINLAKAAILLYSTISAVHGLCQYAKMFNEFVDKKIDGKPKPVAVVHDISKD